MQIPFNYKVEIELDSKKFIDSQNALEFVINTLNPANETAETPQ